MASFFESAYGWLASGVSDLLRDRSNNETSDIQQGIKSLKRHLQNDPHLLAKMARALSQHVLQDQTISSSVNWEECFTDMLSHEMVYWSSTEIDKLEIEEEDHIIENIEQWIGLFNNRKNLGHLLDQAVWVAKTLSDALSDGVMTSNPTTFSFKVPCVDLIPSPSNLILKLLKAAQDLDQPSIFFGFFRTLATNLHKRAGGFSFGQQFNFPSWEGIDLPKGPSKTDIQSLSNEKLLELYLQNTGFWHCLSRQTTYFEFTPQNILTHGYCLGRSGSGKSQAQLNLTGSLLPYVLRGEMTVVIFDPHGDNFRSLLRQKCLALGQYGHQLLDEDRLIVYSIRDCPIQICPFDMNLGDHGSEMEKLSLQREGIELITETLQAIAMDMTAKQTSLLKYATRLLCHVPEATLETMLDLLYDAQPFYEYLEGPEMASLKGFFQNEYEDAFKHTRQEVAVRLRSILSDPVLYPLLMAKRNTAPLGEALNRGSFIIIDSDVSLLGEQGTKLYAQTILSQIFLEIQKRRTLPHNQRLPTFIMADECFLYSSTDFLARVLSESRKYNLSWMGASQSVKILEKYAPGLKDHIATNCATIISGEVSQSDQGWVKSAMDYTGEIPAPQRKNNGAWFTYHNKNLGVTTTPFRLWVEYGLFARQPQMSIQEHTELLEALRERYCQHDETPLPQTRAEPDSPSQNVPVIDD